MMDWCVVDVTTWPPGLWISTHEQYEKQTHNASYTNTEAQFASYERKEEKE